MSARTPKDGSVSEVEASSLMRLVHLIEAANQNRPSSDLDLRARMVIQDLGLAGAAPIVDVRGRLQLTPSTMTSLADRLERGGYVRRQPHPTNRRVIVLELTPKGRRAFQGELDFYRELIDRTLSPLGEEAKRVVLRALARMPSP
jgi:DNA-binding MarR family transcriptional regulator